MDTDAKIFVVGHNDLIERSLSRQLREQGYGQVLSSSEIYLDIFNQHVVDTFFQNEQPAYVFLGSSASGGIQANIDRGGEFHYCNIMSQTNVIHAAMVHGVKKLMYFSSSCVYPRDCPQPMPEDAIMSGPLEPTSEPYALAKLAGIRMCQAYRRQYGFPAVVVIPATVYGPDADTDAGQAHVLGALLGKFRAAVAQGQPEVVVWGSGNPRREFLYADDFVAAVRFLMADYDDEAVINLGSGEEVVIRELAQQVAAVTGFTGKVQFDPSKPDGAPRKVLDSSRLQALGWQPRVSLADGLRQTYEHLTR